MTDIHSVIIRIYTGICEWYLALPRSVFATNVACWGWDADGSLHESFVHDCLKAPVHARCTCDRESVSPVPAAKSRRLAMVGGVSIVLDHAKRYDTPRALWASMLVAALTSWKASDRFVCGGEH